MKKLFTLFAAALLGASAANALVTVTANGNPVKNGETITFYADNFTVEQGVVHTAAAELNFSTNMTQLTISYTSAHTSGTQPTNISICDNSGVCLSENNPMTFQKKSADFEAHIQFLPYPELPASSGSMTITVAENRHSTVKFNIAYDTTQSGVENVATKDNAFTFSGNVLGYTVNAPAMLRVYSIAGNLAYSESIEGAGSADLGHLTPGIYIYNVANKSGKIVIR